MKKVTSPKLSDITRLILLMTCNHTGSLCRPRTDVLIIKYIKCDYTISNIYFVESLAQEKE